MVTDDTKIKSKPVVRETTNTTIVPFKTPAKTTIKNIFTAFEEFAKKRGVTIKAEDFQSVVNAHPEIFELPSDKQADAIVKILIGEQTPKTKTEAEIPSETTTETPEPTETKTPVFGFLSLEDAAQLKKVIDESLNQTTAEGVVNKTIEKSETSEESASAISTNIMSTKELYNECIKQFAKNHYINGPEKHTEEDWNKLTEEEIKQYISDNNINQIANTYIDKSKKNLSIATKGKKNISMEFVLQENLLMLQAANSKNLTAEEFKKLDNIEQGAAIVDIIVAKDEKEIRDTEKKIIEQAKLIKDGVIYAFEHNPKLAGKFSTEAIKNMSYSELYDQLKYTDQVDNLATWVMQYIESIPEEKRSNQATKTLEFLKKAPVASLNRFGTEIGTVGLLESEILQDENYADKYQNTEDPAQKAQLKAEYFLSKYNNNPEMFLQYFDDAIKHADIDEITALANLLDRTDIDVSNIREALKSSEFAIIINEIITNKIGITVDTAHHAMENLGKVQASGVSAHVIQSTAQKITATNHQQAVALSEKMQAYTPAVANGILDGSADAVRDGKLGTPEFTKIGENAGKCCEEVQDHAVDIAGDKTIPSEARGGFTVGLVKNSGYAAAKCVEKHIPATFDDNPDVQKNVFSAMQTSIENNLPKEKSIKILTQLADQVSELNETIQAEAHKMLTNSKYEEVAVYAASNIHTYAESAQAEALQTSYNSGNTKIIEAATLQVNKMSETAVNAMQKEIVFYITEMENQHSYSTIEEYAIRQLKKQFGFNIDTTSAEFKTRLERYIEELKQLPRKELYNRICSDIEYWPADKKALLLENIAKYCPELFVMLLEKFGINLLSSFGHLNSSTKNAILMNMLREPSMRSEAMAYMRENSNYTFSDELLQLYNETYDLMVANGAIIEDKSAPDKIRSKSYQTIPTDLYHTTSLTEIGSKYNWNMKQDINGNIGLIS